MFEAFFANVAPAVTAVPVAVRFVIVSPSGSAAVTVTVSRAFSAPEAVAGAVMIAAWPLYPSRW